MFLISQVTSREHIGLYEFMDGSTLRWVNALPFLLVIGLVQVKR